jgi:hypothetical protein
VSVARCALSIFLSAVPVFACEALQPENPVKVTGVCGRAQDPNGQPLGDFELRLVRQNQALVSEVYTDAAGNFRFPALEKGDYFMTTTTKGWWPLEWPVRVTSSRDFRNCSRPLLVRPSLTCGGTVTKKGYHVKWAR